MYPIKLFYSPAGILIDASMAYNQNTQLPINNKNTFAEIIQKGIRSNWAKEYPLTPKLEKAIKLFAKARKSPYYHTGMKSIKVQILISSSKNPVKVSLKRGACSMVLSPPKRWGWGIFRTGQIESILFNWSPAEPGNINISLNTPDWYLPQLIAHEFGHILGLGDAYAVWYRLNKEAPGTKGFIMNDCGSVHSTELAMVLDAHRTGKPQFFPKG